MNQGNLSRRGFLTRSMTALTVGAGLPAWYANEMLVYAQEQKTRAPASPNDRIVMGVIGTGTNRLRVRPGARLSGERGVQDMRDAQRQPGVQYIAVADVDAVNKDYGATVAGRGNASQIQKFEDYRQLLALRDIDAVNIGTPDHWHVIIAIAALKAGKNVYCEKPLTLTIDEGKTLVRVQRETGKVFQTGSQQRTEMGGKFRLACEMARNGRIGKITKITTLVGANPVGGPFKTEQPVTGLNWDFWQGQTSATPFIKQRCHYEFRWWYEYSGGKMTDWGAHHNDIAQWALNMDHSGPIAVTGTGTPPATGHASYNCHPDFEINYIYGNGPNGGAGTRLVCRSRPPAGNWHHGDNGVLLEGENGKWIWVDRGRINASDGDARTSRILNEPLGAGATRLEVANSQMGNFIHCCRTGGLPICNVNVGHRSVSVCHLGNIAVRFFPGQQLHWNPKEERFTGAHAAEANTHLSRPQRAPYRVQA